MVLGALHMWWICWLTIALDRDNYEDLYTRYITLLTTTMSASTKKYRPSSNAEKAPEILQKKWKSSHYCQGVRSLRGLLKCVQHTARKMLRRVFLPNELPLTFDVIGWQGWHEGLEHPQSMPRIYFTI